MKQSLVSIIIPTYNRAHLICETIDSILAQTYTNWECIVVDDGSTDNTAILLTSYVEKDSRFQYFIRPVDKPKGPNSCRNYGFTKSKGELINWLDSDDLLFVNSIALRVENFDSKTDAVVGKCEIFDSFTTKKIAENTILSYGNIIKDYFLGNITYYVSGPMWRRNFLEKQRELFDEEIRYLDDWDFNLRMIYQNPSIKFLDIPVFKYRYHNYSLSKQIEHSNIEEFKSECIARNKQLKLLSKSNIKNSQIKNFILNRHKIFLREAMLKKDKSSFFFFLKFIGLQFKFKKYFGIIETALVFVKYHFLTKSKIGNNDDYY